MFVAGCATTTLPARTASPDTAPASAATFERCGPSDPDRFGWFCTIGQILYGVLAGTEAGGSIRTK